MEDLFHRKIDYLRISVTDRCNFRCGYCMPKGGVVPLDHKDILTYEEIERLCALFAKIGIQKIKLTGGEPLVRKGFVSLVKRIHQIEGIRQVTMTTNGSLLGDCAADLKKAGLDGVNISLDTLKPEIFAKITGADQLRKILDAIQKSLEEGIPSVKINCVPMRDTNADEICEIAALAKNQPIEVRFIEMMPIGKGRGYEEIGEEEMRRKLEDAYGSMKQEEKKLGNGPATYYKPEGFEGHIGFISAMSHKFCGNCNRIRLTSDGILKPCLQYAGEANLKQLLREGASDQEILTVMQKVIAEKPECHRFHEKMDAMQNGTKNTDHIEERVMTSIGG